MHGESASEKLPSEKLTSADGATIAYRRSPGRGPGVVFFTGYKSDMTGQKAVRLEEACRAEGRAFLRFDYTGHGESSGVFVDGTIGRWRDDAVLVLDRLTEGPQVLVGSSLGGWIALLVALVRPARVAGLIGVAAAPDFTEDLIPPLLSPGDRAVLEAGGIVEMPGCYGEEPTPVKKAFLDEGRDHLLLRAEIGHGCAGAADPRHAGPGRAVADLAPPRRAAARAGRDSHAGQRRRSPAVAAGGPRPAVRHARPSLASTRSERIDMKARSRTSHTALALAVGLAAGLTTPLAAGRADAASGTVFEVAPVIAEIKRQLTAVDAGASAAGPGGLRIEDAQLDLALVENPSGRGAGFVVPGADYLAGTKEETPRPSLKRRLVIEVQPAKKAPAADAAAGPAGAGGGGRLAQTIGELRAGAQQTIATDPAYDLKKFTIDLDFALERDTKGALQLVLFARDKRIDAANVHGLKLRLAADAPPPKDKDPRKEASAKENSKFGRPMLGQRRRKAGASISIRSGDLPLELGEVGTSLGDVWVRLAATT